MSSLVQGAKSTLKASTTAAGTKVDLTGRVSGNNTMTRARATDNSVISGGRGIIANQLGRFVDHSITSSHGSTSTQDAVLRELAGKRAWIDYNETGGTANADTVSGQAVVTWNLVLGFSTNMVMWNVTWAVDGLLA